MSEQEKPMSFLEKLDVWTEQAVIAPLLKKGPEAIAEVHKAIRNKVVDSYHNGRAVGARESTAKPKMEYQE
jgi:hypothetical protein